MISVSDGRQPSFTIITPSFNQGRFIRETIESVLSQGISDIDYHIFDGGSTDSTISVLESFGGSIQWVSEPDKGQADAVNKGLKVAKGGVIGWLNSDDIYYPGALKAVLEVFEQNPEVDILYGMADHIDESGNVLEPYYNEDWNYGRLRDICFLCQPAVFFRKSIIEEFGVLNGKLRYCMDYEYWLRIGRKKNFFYLEKKLAGSRLYRETKTLGSAVAVHEEIMLMFKREFPPIPDRWIFNHAHVVAREKGLKTGTMRDDISFFTRVVMVALWDSLRLRYYIPGSMIKTISDWFSGMIRSRKKREK